MTTEPENPTPPPEESGGGEQPAAGGPERPGGEQPAAGGPERPGGERPDAGGPERPAPPRRLTRSRSDRVVSGVAGGIARHYRLDPTVVRIAFVAGVILWGAGAVLYLAAYMLMPQEGEETAFADRASSSVAALTGRNRTLAAIGVVVLVLVGGPIVLALGFGAAGIAVPFGIVILAGLGAAWLVTGRKPAGGDPGQIAKLTLLGLGVIGVLFVFAAGSFWGAAAGGDTVIAALVIAAGLALVVSAFARPARWLILPALALAIPAAFVAAAGIDLDGGVGEKRYRPATLEDVRGDYEIGAGELTLDLRDVDYPVEGEWRVNVEVGMGAAKVLVPEDVCVTTTAELGMGGVEVFERDGGGIDVDWEDAQTPPSGTPRLTINADIGLGALQVGHVDTGHRRFSRFDDGPGRNENKACDA
jgi:phage shock protein PspC (stress-responsive transcriptional regulator)